MTKKSCNLNSSDAKPVNRTSTTSARMMTAANRRSEKHSRRFEHEWKSLNNSSAKTAAVLRNAHLTGNQKVAALVTIHDLAWQQSKHSDAPYTVKYARLAEKAGTSTQTISNALKVFAKPDGLWDLRVTREKKPTHENPVGEWRFSRGTRPRREYASAIDLLNAAAAYSPTREGSGWGGKRERKPCPDHPNASVIVNRESRCSVCNRLLHFESLLNGQLDHSESVPLEAEEDLHSDGGTDRSSNYVALIDQDDISHLPRDCVDCRQEAVGGLRCIQHHPTPLESEALVA